MEDSIVNRVANSGLLTIDLEQFLPSAEIVTFDLKNYLFKGLILKEKDFREALRSLDWEMFRDKHVAVTCSTDAIIPLWAYMLVASYLQPIAKDIYAGTADEMQKSILLQNIADINAESYKDQRVIVKGCGEQEIDRTAYLEITKRLRPFVKSLMYGEACSNVPIFKNKAT
ncbi:MAG TPA: DUF2480 family protein [Chitinophagaceae bacterium]|jgi:hypothetical protein|nr:DUF2480 family protein [Chitinophagaceae bacterium]